MGKGSVKELSAPLNNRIYFAGEAMNPSGKTIAVHGACESAYLAVSEMLTNKDRRQLTQMGMIGSRKLVLHNQRSVGRKVGSQEVQRKVPDLMFVF